MTEQDEYARKLDDSVFELDNWLIALRARDAVWEQKEGMQHMHQRVKVTQYWVNVAFFMLSSGCEKDGTVPFDLKERIDDVNTIVHTLIRELKKLDVERFLLPHTSEF